MLNGYNQRGLDIDLTAGEVRPFPIPEEILIRNLGGRGLGGYYLSRRVPPAIDPLAPENMLVFASGGLTGSLAPTSGRFSVSFKSPLTGTIASANAGGFWGVSLKRSGWDVLIVHGRSPEPVLLRVDESGGEIIPAADLSGKNIPELHEALSSRYPLPARILGIGPAGENGVLFSALINDLHRAVGRGGVGTVMGSKNLKTVVVSGKKHFPPENRDLYQAGVTQARKLLASMPVTSKALTQLGTAGLVKLIHDHDMLPHRNFQDVYHRPEDVDRVSGEALRREILVKAQPCFNCAIACGRRTQVNGREGEGPEYESLAMMGPNLDIYDIREIALANYACNEAGIDTISFGNTLGLAMELMDKGLMPQAQVQGKKVRFGASGILESLVSLTAHREGIGEDLALGAQRLAEKYGAPGLAMAVKGLEFPGYEPRATMAQALGYATSPRGGCHLQGGYAITLGFFGGAREVDRFLIETTAGHVVTQQDSGCIADSLGICRFSSFAYGENELARIYNGINGVDLSPHDLEESARIIQDRERIFNMAAGFSREDDTLPERMFKEKIIISGEARFIERESHFIPLLEKYYQIRGWNENGVPENPDDDAE